MFQAWKLEQEQLKEQETAKESKKGKKPQQQKQKEVKAKEVKKATDKKSRAGTEGSLAESIADTAPPVVDKAELQPTEEPFKVKLTLLIEHIDASRRLTPDKSLWMFRHSLATAPVGVWSTSRAVSSTSSLQTEDASRWRASALPKVLRIVS